MQAFYNRNKDIERVRRGCGVSRTEAAELLAAYGGKPERVMMEHFGAARVYADPVSVRDPLEETRAMRTRIISFCANARLTVFVKGRAALRVPLMPALLMALFAAPAAVCVVLMALLSGCRLGVDCGEAAFDVG